MKPHRTTSGAQNLSILLIISYLLLAAWSRLGAPAQNSLEHRDDPLGTHIGPQDLGNQDGAIRLLIVLYQRNPRPPNGQPRAIERVQILALSVFRFAADAAAARLKSLAV